MASSILVAYATKHGSTHEVAEAVAARLREHDLDVQVRPAAEVDDVSHFDGVVLGSAIYTGRLPIAARRFLKHHQKALSATRFAVFAMGPRTTESKEIEASRAQLELALAKVPEVTPVSVEIFGGVVDPTKLSFPFSHMLASDARDWDRIACWSDTISAQLDPSVPKPALT
jgi:menaquinone-dependent protoporphyrinogen oxidase